MHHEQVLSREESGLSRRLFGSTIRFTYQPDNTWKVEKIGRSHNHRLNLVRLWRARKSLLLVRIAPSSLYERPASLCELRRTCRRARFPISTQNLLFDDLSEDVSLTP